MGNAIFEAQGGAKKAKLAFTGQANCSRMVRVVGHVWSKSTTCPRFMQIWVETKRSSTIGWVLSRVIEETAQQPDMPNIVGLRVLRKGKDSLRATSDEDAFLDSVEDNLLVDYGEEVDAVLEKGDSLECLFEVSSNSPHTPSIQDTSTPEQDLIGLGHFTISGVIGSGASSVVLGVSHKDSNRKYAIKVMSKRKSMQDEKTIERIVTEKRILAKLSYPFVVSLHWAFQTDGHLFMVLDFCGGGELFEYFQRLGAFSETDSRFYVSEILLGLEYLHSLNILYRDLKLENCLLDMQGHVRLTDFGLSKDDVSEDNLCRSFVGTWSYISPEMLRHEGHGLPLDYYCLGCLLHLLLTERVPHENGDVNRMYTKRANGVSSRLPQGFSEEVGDLLRQLLEADPARRLCQADAVKNHSWFQGVDFSKVLNKVPQPAFPIFPPIDPESQLTQNLDPTCQDLDQSFCRGGNGGTIAGFSKFDTPVKGTMLDSIDPQWLNEEENATEEVSM